MNKLNLKKTAEDIIKNNQYMTIGTVNEGGKSWVSPVVYTFDNQNNFYYMSLPVSQHSTNIKRDPVVSAAIFDSHQFFGEGIGLQIRGLAEVVPIKDSAQVFALYFGRKWPYGNLVNVADFKNFFKLYKYRFYKIRPIEVYMNDPRKEYDTRVKVRF